MNVHQFRPRVDLSTPTPPPADRILRDEDAMREYLDRWHDRVWSLAYVRPQPTRWQRVQRWFLARGWDGEAIGDALAVVVFAVAMATAIGATVQGGWLLHQRAQMEAGQ